MFYKNAKKVVLKDFAKFTGKHLCQSLVFTKVTGETCNFINKENLAQVFSSEFCEIFKNIFLYGTPPLAASGLLLWSLSRWFFKLLNKKTEVI